MFRPAKRIAILPRTTDNRRHSMHKADPMQTHSPEPEDDDHTGDRQFVTALVRGLDILSCFRIGDRYLSNHELARRTGLAKPTVSRLTYTLTRTGHLLRDEASGEYRLSANALRLGYSVLAATPIRDRFLNETAPLSLGPNPYTTIALAEGVGTRAVYLATRRSQQTVSLSIEVGARLPLFHSAIGRAILAGMSDGARAETLAQAIKERPGEAERIERGLADALQDFQRYGYCTSFGAWKPEITAIAAPLASPDGSSIYAVNVGGPSFLVTPEELHHSYGQRLIETVRRIDGR